MAYIGDSSILRKNLSAIKTRQPVLAARLKQASPHSGIAFMESRKGHIIPVLTHNGRALHSKIDPKEEGRRFADAASDGFLIVFGLGGAYHLTSLLQKPGITGIVIVEKDISLVRAIIENIDMNLLFSDPRVTMLVDPEPEECVQTVLDRYLPVLYGNFGSMSLRSRWDAAPEWFSSRADAVRSLPEILGRDYTVQTRFGRRWFANTVINLMQSGENNTTIPMAKRIMITAAGPSLQAQLPRIRQLKQDGFLLLATDTSLPALTGAGLPPDIVLSIDCQALSYCHFIQGLPETTLLVLDLASPPVLTRLTDNVLFCVNKHPFAQYVNSYYRSFPVIDTSGGNVTHAALSLAQAAGAETICLFGADFSWPNGCPYAKGTYIYPWFQSRSNRIDNSESLFWKFMNKARPQREQTCHGWRWRTATLDYYRIALEGAIASMPLQVVAEPGSGVPIVCHRGNPAAHGGEPQFPSGNNGDSPARPGISDYAPACMSWLDFLANYCARLESLPQFDGHPWSYLETLSFEDRQVWATLLPAAASFRESVDNGAAAVKKSREWKLRFLNDILCNSVFAPVPSSKNSYL